MTGRAPVQLPLFGTQYVHLGHRDRANGFVACLMCGVSLAMSEAWDDCGSCPGLVEPVPPWMVLGGEPVQLEHPASREAA